MSTLAERDTSKRVKLLYDALVTARSYVDHKDMCDGLIHDWKLGAQCTCGCVAALDKINTALGA